MRTLNADAADALRPLRPNAVTDVTGFGLLGHAHELASRSGVRVELDATALPALPGGARARGGRRAHRRRPRATASSPARTSRATADEAAEALAYDPQTAGGLLVSLPGGAGRRGARGASRLPASRRARIGRVVAGAASDARLVSRA